MCVLTHAVGGAAPHQQTAGAQQVESPEQQDPPRLKTTTSKQKELFRSSKKRSGSTSGSRPDWGHPFIAFILGLRDLNKINFCFKLNLFAFGLSVGKEKDS